MLDELDLTERPWPHSQEAEQAVLMALLVDKDAIGTVVDQLSPGDFYTGQHQLIYNACLMLFQTGDPICHISVAEVLKMTGEFEDSGGYSYLNDLMLSYLTSQNLAYHVKTVKERALSRRIIQTGWEAVSLAFQRDGTEALAEVQKRLFALDGDHGKETPLKEILDSSLVSLEASLHGDTDGLPTGFSKLDAMLGGLKPSQLVILAARPSMGKTALALNVAANVAIRQNLPVLFFSLEMGPEEIGQRLLVSEVGNSSQITRLRAKAEELKDCPLRIIDRPALGIPQLRAAIMRHKVEFKQLGLVVVDYLQLMSGHGENRVQEVSLLSRELKILAREFEIPILCLSQLSRAVESRQDKKPMLSDLRDSGAIEQDADVVMFIYREDYYNKDAAPGTATVIVAKNRNGPVGEITLGFRPAATQFRNI